MNTSTRLNPGDRFPDLDLQLVSGETLHLPDHLAGQYGVVLVNRGAWCPYCTAQLTGFQRAQQTLTDVGGAVVSLSVDDEPTTQVLVDQHRLTFPIGHSAEADKVSELTGAFVNRDPLYLQATGFILDPQGRVLISVYSSGAIGRINADDAVGFIRYVQQHA